MRQQKNNSLETAQQLAQAKTHCCLWRDFSQSKTFQGCPLNMKDGCNYFCHWLSVAGTYSSHSRPFSQLPNTPGTGRGFLQWHLNLVLLKTKLPSEQASTSYYIHLDTPTVMGTTDLGMYRTE